MTEEVICGIVVLLRLLLQEEICCLQDPLHYPHGTKFMAPGPMGQCFPVPDDDSIKQQMMTTAENAEKIYRMYNFDYVTKVRRVICFHF